MFTPVKRDITLANGERFTIRKPSIRDRMAIESRLQRICLEERLVFDLISNDVRLLLQDVAMLDILVEAAPDTYYTTTTAFDGKPERRIKFLQDHVEVETVREVAQEVDKFLREFQGNQPSPSV